MRHPRASGRGRLRSFIALALLAILACSHPKTRVEWQQTPHGEKVLYVRALIGAEKAQAAKGGGERRYSKTSEEYVREIDASYARGDQRDVNTIFAGMADR